MISGVITNDIHDRRVRAQRIVQVRQTVREAWTQVQERYRRTIEHARVSVGRTGHYALEQTQHTAHVADAVEGGDKVHFRCARVGKTDIDVISRQGSEQTLSAVHG